MRGRRMERLAAERGMTLVELLAALVLSALVVALASRLFMAGHSQFLARAFETDRLSGLIRLKSTLRQALQGEIARCEGGRLQLAVVKRAAAEDGEPSGHGAGKGAGSEGVDLATFLKARFPGADSLEFRCYETGPEGGDLVEWKQRFQPQLVEYRILMRTRKAADRLEGSVLRF